MTIQYQSLLRDILDCGVFKGDRTGTGTQSLFGAQIRFDMADGFPLLTTKKVFFKAVVHELLWFLRGDTNIKYLNDNGVRIWDEWADENGDLGPVYGKQWRAWEGIREVDGEYRRVVVDQLGWVAAEIVRNPNSRRLIVSAWNPIDVDDMALPPCHCLFQFYVAEGKLSLQLYQRSADVFLGVPFNIASYALLLHMMAHATGLEAGEFIHSFGDVHIYNNHRDQVQEQLGREPRIPPKLFLNPQKKGLMDITYEDIQLVGYDPHPPIKGEVSV